MNLNELLQKQTSERKLRLFSVACCYEIIDLMKDSRSLQAVKIAELYANGLCTQEELRKACAAAYTAAVNIQAAYGAPDARYSAAYDAEYAAFTSAADAAYCIARATKERHLKIAEDIFSVPTTVTFPRSPLILTIAQSIYEDKCWSDMPILADALEDAHCIDKQIVDHLRSNQPHFRGCWVLDLILGKQ